MVRRGNINVYVFFDAVATVAAFLSQTTTVHLGIRYSQTHRRESKGSEQTIIQNTIRIGFIRRISYSRTLSMVCDIDAEQCGGSNSSPHQMVGKMFSTILWPLFATYVSFTCTCKCCCLVSFRFFLLCSCSLHFKSNTKYRMETEIRSRCNPSDCIRMSFNDSRMLASRIYVRSVCIQNKIYYRCRCLYLYVCVFEVRIDFVCERAHIERIYEGKRSRSKAVNKIRQLDWHSQAKHKALGTFWVHTAVCTPTNRSTDEQHFSISLSSDFLRHTLWTEPR